MGIIGGKCFGKNIFLIFFFIYFTHLLHSELLP